MLMTWQSIVDEGLLSLIQASVLTSTTVIELILFISITATLFSLWQVARTPNSRFNNSRFSKVVWFTLILGAWMLSGVGGAICGIYFIWRVKPKLKKETDTSRTDA
jgi:hypothetical protein